MNSTNYIYASVVLLQLGYMYLLYKGQVQSLFFSCEVYFSRVYMAVFFSSPQRFFPLYIALFRPYVYINTLFIDSFALGVYWKTADGIE